MRLFLVFLISLFCANACERAGSNTQAVVMYISPGGEQKNHQPLVTLHPGGNQVCRRGKPPNSIYGLEQIKQDEDDSQSDTSSDNEGDGATRPVEGENTSPANSNNDGDNDSNSNQAVKVETTPVGENWFKTGLVVLNQSKDAWLIIDSLDFSITGTWGNATLQGTAQISSGYCGTDPLYIVNPVPATANERSNPISGTLYQPLKENYINNMTLYIDGVPIPTGPPDRGGGSTVQQARQSTTPSGGGEGGGGAGGGTAPAAGGGNQNKPFVLDRLPNYKVQVVARGYWINQKREFLHNFEKSFSFSLTSSFRN